MTKPDFFLLRSALYVPGSNERALARCPEMAADAIILDLEDSVAPEAKAAARQAIAQTLAVLAGSGKIRAVRLNAVDSPYWQDDLAALPSPGPEVLVIPKVEDSAPLTRLCQWYQQHSTAPLPQLWPMIESPLAVLRAYSIASHPGVTALVMGTADLAKALHLPSHGPERANLHFALQSTVLAARAAGVAILDGVYGQFRDEAGFAAQCREGAALGFDGKTLIHPTQIPLANQTFLPTAAELALARQVVAAWQAASAEGAEICVVEGRMIERLHARDAQRLIALWEKAQ